MIILPRKTLPAGGRTTLPSQDEPNSSAAQRPTFEGWGPRI
jgi:hypothetical protein